MNIRLAQWLRHVINDKKELEAIDTSEERIVSAYKQLLSGYTTDPSKILTVTKETSDHEGIVVQRNICFCSICRHHFIPFYGTISIAYEPGPIIVGLGKLNRLAAAYARRLQIQEDIVRQIAEELMQSGKAKGAYVLAAAKHLCICARGPKDDTSQTIATYALGSLARAEQEARMLALFQYGIANGE